LRPGAGAGRGRGGGVVAAPRHVRGAAADLRGELAAPVDRRLQDLVGPARPAAGHGAARANVVADAPRGVTAEAPAGGGGEAAAHVPRPLLAVAAAAAVAGPVDAVPRVGLRRGEVIPVLLGEPVGAQSERV